MKGVGELVLWVNWEECRWYSYGPQETLWQGIVWYNNLNIMWDHRREIYLILSWISHGSGTGVTAVVCCILACKEIRGLRCIFIAWYCTYMYIHLIQHGFHACYRNPRSMEPWCYAWMIRASRGFRLYRALKHLRTIVVDLFSMSFWTNWASSWSEKRERGVLNFSWLISAECSYLYFKKCPMISHI